MMITCGIGSIQNKGKREHMWSHDFLESNTAHVQPSHPLSYDLHHYLIGMVTTWHFSKGPALGPKKKTPSFCFFYLIKGWKWEVRRWWSWTGGEGVEGSRELRGGVSKKETRSGLVIGIVWERFRVSGIWGSMWSEPPNLLFLLHAKAA
jgi:hypothetical protein